MMGYGTGFTQTEALLAVLQGDMEEARRIVGELLPHERRELGLAAADLADLIRQMRLEQTFSKYPAPWDI
jgi:signal transduction histidine kinase